MSSLAYVVGGAEEELVDCGPPGEAETQQGGQLREREQPRALNIEEESSEHLKRSTELLL